MKYLKQFGIIVIISFIGELFHYLIPLPIPASIYGIVLLLLCLEFKIIPLKAVKDTGKLLIEIMPIMFIPAAAGIINVWNIIKPSWAQYLTIMVVSTILVMGVSGLVTQFVIRLSRKHAQKNGRADTPETSRRKEKA